MMPIGKWLTLAFTVGRAMQRKRRPRDEAGRYVSKERLAFRAKARAMRRDMGLDVPEALLPMPGERD